MTIYPTGKCFDHALDYTHEQVSRDHALRYQLVLVHGICLVPDDEVNRNGAHGVASPPPGGEFAHAWVEDLRNGVCIDFGLYEGQLVAFTVKRGDYYRHYRVQVTTKYFVDDAIKANHRSGHFGPWESTYRHLCRDTRGNDGASDRA